MSSAKTPRIRTPPPPYSVQCMPRYALRPPGLLSGIFPGVACIEVAAQSWHLGVQMSAASFSACPSEANASPVLAATNTAVPAIQLAKVAEPAAHFLPLNTNFSPVNGLVGRCFIRMCLWVDLVTAWSRRNRPIPQWSPELAVGLPIATETTEQATRSAAN